VRRRAVLVPTKRDRADRDGCTEALRFTNGFTAETRRPMQSGFAESGKVVCLFCLLGLALAAALIPMLAPEDLTWVLSHVE
jgi:hypothetical protein